jgi:hypothetical protein
MRTRVYQRWVSPDTYVQVEHWIEADEVDIKVMTRDPRKAQYHKPKFWNHGLWMPCRLVDTAILQLRSGMVGVGPTTRAALAILKEDISRTSSDRRAIAS